MKTWLFVIMFAWPAFNLANPLLDAMKHAPILPEALEQAKKQLQNPKSQRQTTPLFVPPFHHRASDSEDQASFPQRFCLVCHDKSPHRDNSESRAFLNMHGRFIACESCHWQPSTSSLEYARDTRFASIQQKGLIAPFQAGRSLIILAQGPHTLEWQTLWHQGTLEQRARLKAQLHQPLKKQGLKCTRCHTATSSGLLDWATLGYADSRLHRLQHNPIARFLSQRPSEPSSQHPKMDLRDLLE